MGYFSFIKKLFLFFIFLLGITFFLASSGFSISSGIELAKKIYFREDGKDFYAELDMLLIDKHGNQRKRSMVMYEKDYNELRKVLIRFISPADIKGTTFLSWENRDRDDDQFLYLPALRRVRRIVSSKKDNSFVNSDFTYEDMERRKPQKDHHRIIGEEVYNKWNCWILESIPKKHTKSQYGKIISWVEKNSYIPIKMNLYSKNGILKKQLFIFSLKRVQGIWTAMETEMVNLKENHKTRLIINSIKYNLGLSDEIFTKRYMCR